MNQIQIAHWAVLMKKVYWTPPSYNSLFNILLFTAFTAKQYYCHPNDFPIFTYKLDFDRPGFVLSHSHWVKQNSINIRSWEVNQKFNKLKRPLNGYTQKSFGAESISGKNQLQNGNEYLGSNQEDNQDTSYNINKKEAHQNKRAKVNLEKNQTHPVRQNIQYKTGNPIYKQNTTKINQVSVRQQRRYSNYQKLIQTMDSGGTDMLGLQNQTQKLKQIEEQRKKNMESEIDQFVKELEKKQKSPIKNKQPQKMPQNTQKKQDFLEGIPRQKTDRSQFDDQINDMNFLNDELIFQQQSSITQNSNDGLVNEDDYLLKLSNQKSYCIEPPKLQKNQSYL